MRASIKVLLVVTLLAAGPISAAAQTIVVDTDQDRADPPFDADGPCGTGTVADLPGADGHVSLREAILRGSVRHHRPGRCRAVGDDDAC